MIDFTEKSQYGFADLVSLVRALRAPGGCAWDRAQTHASIRRNFLEEAYEACEAMDEGSPEHLREELGDVLLQVVFHALIESEAGTFGVDEVCDGVCRKLIRRHPHLFTPDGSPMEWEALKRAQRGNQTVAESMEGISKALPALWQADKLLEKASRSGLYELQEGEALRESAQALAALCPDPGSVTEEDLGAALFALAALARSRGFDPEEALLRRCRQFIASFSEREAQAAGGTASPEK